MDEAAFKTLFKEHRGKIFEAWNQISEEAFEKTGGDLKSFCRLVSETYKIPERVVLRELDAVQRNIRKGIETDFATRHHPEE